MNEWNKHHTYTYYKYKRTIPFWKLLRSWCATSAAMSVSAVAARTKLCFGFHKGGVLGRVSGWVWLDLIWVGGLAGRWAQAYGPYKVQWTD